MYPDPAALVQTRMSDLRREADLERRALRIKTPKSTERAPRRSFRPALLVFGRLHHA